VAKKKRATVKTRRQATLKPPAGGRNMAVTEPSRGASVGAAKWTFLTNHAHVLTVLDANPDMVLREVALRVGITERAVQRIIVDLEESGFLERTRVGRKNHYRVITDKPLRHPIESHRTIGDLLALITNPD
jgi:predicted transcriptional regulator